MPFTLFSFGSGFLYKVANQKKRGCPYYNMVPGLLRPTDWQRSLIADGLFTVESDRAVVMNLGETDSWQPSGAPCPFFLFWFKGFPLCSSQPQQRVPFLCSGYRATKALRSKTKHLNQWGPLTDYRFHLAQEPRLLGQRQGGFSLQSFLRHFKFPSLQSAVKHEGGMTGMLCAIVAGDGDIVQTLVRHGADVNAGVRGLVHFGYSDSLTLLMVAAYNSQEPQILSTLIMAHADPNLACVSETGSRVTAAMLATRPGHVQVLLEMKEAR